MQCLMKINEQDDAIRTGDLVRLVIYQDDGRITDAYGQCCENPDTYDFVVLDRENIKRLILELMEVEKAMERRNPRPTPPKDRLIRECEVPK